MTGGVPGMGMDDGSFGIMVARLEVTVENGGQPGGVTGPAEVGHVRGNGDEVGLLRFQPCPRRAGVTQPLNGDGRREEAQQVLVLRREQGIYRGRRYLKVVVKE